MSDDASPEVKVSNELECQGCGAILKFKPGTHHLSCEYCGAENEIFNPDDQVVTIEETSLEEYLQEGLRKEEKIEIVTVRCDGCGGSFTFEPNLSSDFCPFCSSPKVIQGGTTASVYKPGYLLPFDISRNKALSNYQHWLKSLWFAPGDLKHYADNNDHFNGMYIPFWTYDCHTRTQYSGARGRDYQVQRQVNVIENGKSVTRTRYVTKTRWQHASGEVQNIFDDILVVASSAVSQHKMNKIKAWDLDNLVPYDDKYLSGFRTETYTVNIEDGYENAKTKMHREIVFSVKQDIGGDRQRIDHLNTQYSGASFKQILVPIWLSAYRYKGKVYQFVVNGRTGAIAGDRPYSTKKIVLAILGGLLLILLVSLFVK